MNKGNIVTHRQSNIELLRVISMFMVLLGHYYVLSYFDNVDTISFNLVGMQFLGAWSKVAVDIFVIITGHFLVNQTFRWKKVLKLLSCTYFWGIIVLLLGFALGLSVKADYIYKSLFPLTPLNWFARSYLLLYVSIPLFNKIIKCRKNNIFWLLPVNTYSWALVTKIIYSISCSTWINNTSLRVSKNFKIYLCSI